MHMADALLSPAAGIVMWTASAGTLVWAAKKIKNETDSKVIPLMGILGAFVFTSQMINFTIPGTGSSGHLGGGMLLAILLGPHAAFLSIASVLLVQALFFADGGLLALGCNIFNMGFIPCFLVYPFIYKPIEGNNSGKTRAAAAVIFSAICALALGSLGVVLQTAFSGISSIPLFKFILLMLPIHLAIGTAEGIITLAVVSFLKEVRPDLTKSKTAADFKKYFIIISAAALITGGVISWFASANPDGLEWAIFHSTGTEEPERPGAYWHNIFSALQEKLAFMPDYSFKTASRENSAIQENWPAVNPGTSISGIIGGLLVVLVLSSAGIILRRRSKRR
ncbi:MAG: cobalamin biosynthesis protein CbiM [Spirochaetes bacterium GWF1_41_5]|nr:MAG: cobalamin biosynthesis protein CbiM [Spirochaetes bacterium GWF1_41_5]HBE02846.1 cobalamin biosynthesis protein CbiM [Spirochaetia bacterium]